MEKSVLIILRGNSGSGKTTIARRLQKVLGENTMVISQDTVRREMLNAHDGADTPALPLIKQLVLYGSEHCSTVILEGILRSKRYEELFEYCRSLYKDEIYAYYFDLSFEETCRRHSTRECSSEFTAEQMKQWWKEQDCSSLLEEQMISEEKTEEEIITGILDDIQ